MCNTRPPSSVRKALGTIAIDTKKLEPNTISRQSTLATVQDEVAFHSRKMAPLKYAKNYPRQTEHKIIEI